MDITDVRDLLDHLNNSLYGGQVFRARVVSASRREMGGLYAKSAITWDGYSGDVVAATIYFDEDDLSRHDKEVALTAYHELNHVAGGPDDGHGPRWIRRMESGGAKVIYRRKVDGSIGASQELIPGGRLDDALKEFFGEREWPDARGNVRANLTPSEDWTRLVDDLFRRSGY
jgi:hypothetical protein